MSMLEMEDVFVDMAEYENQPEEWLYDCVKDKHARKVLLTKFKPNGTLWSKKLAAAVKNAQKENQRSRWTSTLHGLRILIQRQTLYAMENGLYECPDGEKVEIPMKELAQSAKRCKFYTNGDIENIAAKNKKKQKRNSSGNDEEKQPSNAVDADRYQCNVDVANTDCLDAAYQLLCDGYNPCVLNMANANNPGGGFHYGAGAQEENLCRRTTLITALVNFVKSRKQLLHPQRKWKYPITTFGTIYVPNVLVFRSNETSGYEFLQKPYKLSIVTAAMHKWPKYDEHHDYTAQYKPEIVNKLRSVLRTAYHNGHHSIVLSAWGCGAFRNPPLGQSKLWKQVLLGDAEFQGKFKNIIFAIFDDHNTGKDHNPMGNYLPFIQTFEIEQKRIREFMAMKQSNDADMNDGQEESMKLLCTILSNATKDDQDAKTDDADDNRTRDLDFNAIVASLGNSSAALNVLYCAGFKRSADGSRLQLEPRRAQIAKDVYERLLLSDSETNNKQTK